MFDRNEDEESNINNFMKCLLLDMQKGLDDYKGKEKVYRILLILHNLPKAMHGQNILNNSCNVISYEEALVYARAYMDEKMRKEYKEYLG